jgi:D-alanyl-D-alanine carboxypeptidase
MAPSDEATMTPFDDIPEASRDTPYSSPQTAASRRWLWLVGAAAGTAALASGGFVAWYQATQVAQGETFEQPFQSIVAGTAAGADNGDSRDVAVQLAPTSRTLLGHRAYDIAPEDDLISLRANSQIRLRRAAAEQFEAMAQDAANDGITLVPLSGYRTLAEQEHLFFDIKAQRGQDAHTRAEVSAPPGYSEHHTGYAIDIGDANHPDTHVNEGFGETAAFQWLQENAPSYGFELSFPPENLQGVAFEPWHWRFAGDRDSLETFYVEETSPPAATSSQDTEE